MSLFIAPSALAEDEAKNPGSLAATVNVLEHIRTHHRTSASGTIRDLVLQDIAHRSTPDALLTSVLDAIIDFLPGGTKPIADRVYLGSAIESRPPYMEDGSNWNPYLEGITNIDVTNWHLNNTEKVYTDFLARYPSILWHGYGSWEVFLPEMMRKDRVGDLIPPSRVRAAYLAYQKKLLEIYARIAPGKSFLWSPALDRPIAQLKVDNDLEAFKSNSVAYFSELKLNVASTGDIRLCLQDGLSRSALLIGGTSNNTVESRIEWYRVFSALNLGVKSVEMNAELFTSSWDPSAGSRTAVRSRLHAYSTSGVPLGACFDLPWWRSNVDVPHD